MCGGRRDNNPQSSGPFFFAASGGISPRIQNLQGILEPCAPANFVNEPWAIRTLATFCEAATKLR